MRINSNKIALWISIFFILISPIENVVRIESYLYLVSIALLLLLLLRRRSLVLEKGPVVILLYLMYCFVTCLWSPNPAAFSGMIPLTAAILFLLLQLQFEYDAADYEKLKNTFIIQGTVLLLLCTRFGSYMDGRFWLKTDLSGADPNYLSGWFIMPICFAIEKMLDPLRKPIIRLAMLIEVMGAIYFIFQTGSRSGFVAIVVTILLAVIYALRGMIKAHPCKAGIIVVAFIALAYIAVRNMPEIMRVRLLSSDSNLGGRGHLWQELITALLHSPIGFIFGMGQVSTIYYNTGRVVAHNTYLDILFNNGLVGLLLVLSYLKNGFARAKGARPYAVVANIGMIVLTLTLSALSTRFFMLSYFILGGHFETASNDSGEFVEQK